MKNRLSLRNPDFILLLAFVFMVAIALLLTMGNDAAAANIERWEVSIYTGTTTPLWTHETPYGISGNTTVAGQDNATSGASIFFAVGSSAWETGASTFNIDNSKNAYAFALTGVTVSIEQQSAGGDSSGVSLTIVAWTASEDTPAAWAAAEMHTLYYGKPLGSASTPYAYPIILPPNNYMRLGALMTGVTPLDGITGELIKLPGGVNWVEPQADVIAPAEIVTITDAAVYSFWETLGDPPVGTKRVWISFEGAVRITDDGFTDPTTSSGAYHDEMLPLFISREMWYKIRAISESGNVEATIHYLNY